MTIPTLEAMPRFMISDSMPHYAAYFVELREIVFTWARIAIRMQSAVILKHSIGTNLNNLIVETPT